HGRRPPPPSQGIVSDAREARHVRRRWPRLRPRRTVSWVAEPVREVSVAPADEAIVVLGMERALRLLPVVRPRSLNVVEIVEAANACTRSSHLTAEGRLYDLGDALGVPRGITRYPASGNAAPRQALGRWRLDILAVTRSCVAGLPVAFAADLRRPVRAVAGSSIAGRRGAVVAVGAGVALVADLRRAVGAVAAGA